MDGDRHPMDVLSLIWRNEQSFIKVFGHLAYLRLEYSTLDRLCAWEQAHGLDTRINEC